MKGDILWFHSYSGKGTEIRSVPAEADGIGFTAKLHKRTFWGHANSVSWWWGWSLLQDYTHLSKLSKLNSFRGWVLLYVSYRVVNLHYTKSKKQKPTPVIPDASEIMSTLQHVGHQSSTSAQQPTFQTTSSSSVCVSSTYTPHPAPTVSSWWNLPNTSKQKKITPPPLLTRTLCFYYGPYKT